MTGDELSALVAKVSQTPSTVVQRVDRMLANFKR